MSKDAKNQLIRQAMKLAALGAKVEQERKHLKKLVRRGIPYSSPEMLATLARFEEADAEWKRLELEYLALKQRLELQCRQSCHGTNYRNLSNEK